LTKIVNDEASWMGSSLAFSDDVLFVGESRNSTRGTHAGAGFVFTRQKDGTFKQTQKLAPADLKSGDFFGNAASLSGDFLAIGAEKTEPRTSFFFRTRGHGAVYIFKRLASGSFEQVRLLNHENPTTVPAEEVGDSFGTALGLHNENLVVCADADWVNNMENVGRAWLSRYNTTSNVWPSPTPLNIEPILHDTAHCDAARVDENHLTVSSSTFNDGRGRVTFFAETASGYQLESHSHIASTTAKDYFGRSLSRSGSMLAVGAPGRAQQSGGVDIFAQNSGGTWVPIQTLHASTPNALDQYGIEVAMTDDALLIAAPFYDYPRTNGGIVYFYRREGVDWVEHATIQPEDLTESAYFGRHIAIDKRNVAITGGGAVYLYELDRLLK